ncbi:hypothetical protein CEXT_746801 [Caerostris extrusa]|uniref:Uncharacterized protein n=1 Tax=Caerostris extrusa TaxID=172846 RepID=A0AAV4WY15_CAEEX|nr:hypothetical protein CEXT_746801 [Caerostris extrusa]
MIRSSSSSFETVKLNSFLQFLLAEPLRHCADNPTCYLQGQKSPLNKKGNKSGRRKSAADVCTLLTPGNHSLSAIARDTAGKIIARRSDGRQDKNHNQEYRPRNEKRLLLSPRSMPALLLGMFAFSGHGSIFPDMDPRIGKKRSVSGDLFVHNRVLSFAGMIFRGNMV